MLAMSAPTVQRSQRMFSRMLCFVKSHTLPPPRVSQPNTVPGTASSPQNTCRGSQRMLHSASGSDVASDVKLKSKRSKSKPGSPRLRLTAGHSGEPSKNGMQSTTARKAAAAGPTTVRSRGSMLASSSSSSSGSDSWRATKVGTRATGTGAGVNILA
eukprot:3272730-Rhodomonas_salina.2